ncbi:MAG: fibronectin type III domain-containing protein [Candidatus Peribacteraceae bacterium]|jgi:hypothetical protein|nr:hypothetical protein [bacterium]MDP6561390.1 fibronectin type III domain-containing protein [Candidatus Peribacteraceae bacterium]|tara:strand:- start:11366 stop:12898 length:1533 start_codon:yes stop_codon:yes gene_type:complete
MNTNTRKHRLSLAVALVIGLLPSQAFAASQDATFELYPHCIEREGKDDEWIFGPIPSPGIVVETRDIEGVRCSSFEVQDPQTLRTRPLKPGDILDIDLVIDNPSKQPINRVRTWLSYDPNMLGGEAVTINKKFSLVTPDEKGFSRDEGYVKMEASTDGKTVNDEKILFARIQLRVIKTNPIGTPITFHDVQPNGHSVIMEKSGDEESYIVKEEPGVLLVTFLDDGLSSEEDTENDDIGNIFDSEPDTDVEPEPEAEPEPEPEPEAEAEPDPNACLRDEDCGDGTCTAGQCEQKPALLSNGASCSYDDECESGLCGSGICVPNLSDEPTNEQQVAQGPSGERTAFSLLQIRNTRVTTDGSSVFLAWDHLRSSQLKAYTVYYSKTSGRYMQRRTIDKSENSLTLRSLEPGKRYYFAVRALSKKDEESAFSREVSIVVGDPDSSSAPLVAGSISTGPGKNPVANLIGDGGPVPVPGETGLPSAMALFLIGSAVVGTTFASRRQFVVSDFKPHE